MPEPIRGLTLTQPWASLVALREKLFETRGWTAQYRGWLAIHAAASFPGWARELVPTEPFRSALAPLDRRNPHLPFCDRDLPLGSIVAVARLVCVYPTEDPRRKRQLNPFLDATFVQRPRERAFGDYAFGRYAWALEDVRALATPIRHRGALSLWHMPKGLGAQLCAFARGGPEPVVDAPAPADESDLFAAAR